MSLLGFLFGAMLAVIVARAICTFLIGKVNGLTTQKRFFGSYLISAFIVFIVPAVGMSNGSEIRWLVGSAVYLPILLLFFLWDLKKLGMIDRASPEKNFNWRRGIWRLWAIIFIPIFIIIQYYSLTNANLAATGSQYYTYEGAMSNSIDAYYLLVGSIFSLLAIFWVKRGFSS